MTRLLSQFTTSGLLGKPVYKDANYTLIQGDTVFADSTAGAITMTLPAGPEDGDYVGVYDQGQAADVYWITIDRNGNTIDALAEDVVIDVPGGRWEFVYDGANVTWRGSYRTVNDSGLTQAETDARVALYAPTSGTFTPTIQDDTLSDAEGQTYTTQVGYYRLSGDVVFYWLDIAINSLGTLTVGEQARIAGLPFTAANLVAIASTIAVGQSLAITAGQVPSGYVVANTSYIGLTLWDNAAGTTNLLISELSAGGRLLVSGSYIKA